jgi:hypothetical protein
MNHVHADFVPHIETIKSVAKKYGIEKICLDTYIEADLPWDTARINLLYFLPEDVDERALIHEIVEKVGIATYIINIECLSEPIRTYAIEGFEAL